MATRVASETDDMASPDEWVGPNEAAKNIAANMKRKMLPPRTLGSVPGLMPCLQQSNPRARHTRATPSEEVLSLREAPARNKIQPRIPAAGTMTPNFVFMGFQNEIFCIG